MLGAEPQASASPFSTFGLRPEPLARLGNYAAAGVCAVGAYEILLLAGALLVFVSGSLAGALVLSLFNLLLYVVMALSGIPFIAWFHRAYKNLPLLGISPRFSSNWAIGCWFIPFANWVLPGMIGDEIWRAGRPQASAPRAEDWNLARIWWGVYIGSGLLGMLLLFAVRAAGSARGFAFVLALSAVMVVVSAVLAIAFVRRASERLDALSGHSPPGDALDRAIASVYEALPVSDGLVERGGGPTRASTGPRPPTAAEPASSATTASCSRCGRPQEAGANFCDACGTPLGLS